MIQGGEEERNVLIDEIHNVLGTRVLRKAEEVSTGCDRANGMRCDQRSVCSCVCGRECSSETSIGWTLDRFVRDSFGR